MFKRRTGNSKLGRKPKALKDSFIHKTNVRLNDDMKRKMREAMLAEGDESDSVFIRRIIRRYLNQREK